MVEESDTTVALLFWIRIDEILVSSRKKREQRKKFFYLPFGGCEEELKKGGRWTSLSTLCFSFSLYYLCM